MCKQMMVFACVVSLTLSYAEAAQSDQQEKAEAVRWTAKNGEFSCVIPEGWEVNVNKPGKVILMLPKTAQQMARTKNKAFKGDAFITIDSDPQQGSLDAYSQGKLRALQLNTPLRNTTMHGQSAKYAETTVNMPGYGRILDVLTFMPGKQKYHTVMLNCDPQAKATHFPIYTEFLQSLQFEGE